jgi:hypothetical protein
MDLNASKTENFVIIVSLLESTPLEDGMTHLAEKYIERFIDQYGISALLRLVDSTDINHRADLIRILGRIDDLSDDQNVIEFISKAIQSSNLRVRDAAIQSIECWNNTAYLPILKSNLESVDWLREYKEKIILELENKKLVELVKSNLKVEFSMDSEETDEPAYYGDNCSVRASVRVFFKGELIYEDSSSETVYR